jgi:hypothetical protein
MINYDNRVFVSVKSSENGEVNEAVRFFYKQKGHIVTCNYSGGKVVSGHLMAIVGSDGKLDMRYHHINTAGQLMTGTCISTPEILPNGKIRLHENWQWTSGDASKGQSILEEE